MTELTQTPTFIGVDVAKEEIVVAFHGQSHSRTLANQKAPLRAWLKTLPPDALIGLESTGGYHELLATLAHLAGLTVYLLNPRDVRHYAQALGKRAKTDHVDALLLARFIAHEHSGLFAWQPPTPEQHQLDQMLKRRAAVVKSLGAMRQSLAHLPPCLEAEAKNALEAMNKLTESIDRQIQQATSAKAEIGE